LNARRVVALTALGLVLIGLVLSPLLGLFEASVAGDGLARYLALATSESARDAMAKSVELSLWTVVAAAAVGIPLAFLTRGLGVYGRLLRGLAFAPLLLTPVLGVLGFYFLCGKDGALDRLVPFYAWEFRGFGAVLVVHAFTLFPFFFAFTTAALDRLDPALYDAARTLGAAPFKAGLRVVLPALLPSLLGAAALTFMSSMASFTAPYVFGRGFRTATVAIVVARQDDAALAAALAVVLLVVSLLSLLPLAFLSKTTGGGKGVAAASDRAPSGTGFFLRSVAATLLCAAAFAPLLTVLLVSLKERGRLGAEGLFESLTLAHYRVVVDGALDPRAIGPAADFAASVGRSLLYAAIATAAGLLFSIPLTLVSRGAPRALRAAYLLVAALPFAVPGTVLAVAMIESFAEKGPFGLFPGIVGGVVALPLAYFVRNLPLHVRANEAAIERLPLGIEDAARTLGLGPFRTALRVVVPAILPGATAGALLAFVSAAGEFVASFLLFTVFTKPASVAVYEAFGGAEFGVAAAAGTLLALATALGALALRGLSIVAGVALSR
jgi:iron(III) transport system permease protein